MSEFVIPAPTVVIATKKFWRKRSIREALAKAAGEPAPAAAADDEHLMQSRELRQMLGGVSDMFLWRHSVRDADTAVKATHPPKRRRKSTAAA
jgi:hypothetical protein